VGFWSGSTVQSDAVKHCTVHFSGSSAALGRQTECVTRRRVFIEQCQADGGPKPGSEKLRRLGVPDRASENKRGLGGGRYRRAQQQYQHSSWINSECSGVRCQELPTTDTLPNRPLYGLSTSMAWHRTENWARNRLATQAVVTAANSLQFDCTATIVRYGLPVLGCCTTA